MKKKEGFKEIEDEGEERRLGTLLAVRVCARSDQGVVAGVLQFNLGFGFPSCLLGQSLVHASSYD